jgi:2-keto-4-pentenoate hydratase/2-oxohepta-3-ene-1,7-dioic acid hydratase in catechol pathway
MRAKGADTFCPFGPWITTVEEIGVRRDIVCAAAAPAPARRAGMA